MTVNHKNILREIQDRQLKTFCPWKNLQNRGGHIEELPTNHSGLYWIWTNLPFDQLQTIQPSEGDIKKYPREVPIEKLVTQRLGLTGIIDKNKIVRGDEFTIVYNGIGGYKKSFGLRERILQEFNNKDPKTGALNIVQRLAGRFDVANWGFSFFDFDSDENSEFVKKNDLAYEKDAEDLERNWRIEYGMPILVRR